MLLKKYYAFFLTLLVYAGLNAQQYYLKDWLISTPFQNDSTGTRLIKDYFNGENLVFPVGGEKIEDNFWSVYHSDENFIDFLNPILTFGNTDNKAVYVCFYIFSDTNRDKKIFIGSDDGISFFINENIVYTNDVYRSFSLDEDTVLVNLKEGLNRFLFKVSNGYGDWKLSVKFENSAGIRQILNPPELFSNKSITPADIELLSYSWDNRFMFDGDGKLTVPLSLNFLNKGMKITGNIRIVLQSEKEILGFGNLKQIIGGEIKNLSLNVNLNKLLEHLFEKKPLKLITSENEDVKSFDIEFPGCNEILTKTFSEWDISHWEESVSESEEIFETEIILPDFLKSFDLKFSVFKEDSHQAGLFINHQFIKSFKRSAVAFEIGDAFKSRDKILIEIRSNAKQNLKLTGLSGILKIEDRDIQKYLESEYYIRKLYDIDIGESGKVDSEILSDIYNRKYNNIISILDEINPLIEKYHKLSKDITIHLIGNAHIDLAWLWRYSETIEIAKNTFEQALENMELLSDFKFSQSQAQLYYWIEKEYPALFDRIKEKVKEGKWEIVGGMWAEPDVNMPSGESLARQFLYGKRYFKEKFGVDVKTGYLPDTFGHPRTLPMIMKNSGIDYFLYYRPSNKASVFQWKSRDNSSVLTCRPQEWYNSPVTDDIGKIGIGVSKSQKIKNVVRFYGVGDHGGGPTLRDINTAKQLDSVYVYPNIKFSRLDDFFKNLEIEKVPVDTLKEELNFVFRGCWTSQAKIKKMNRIAEYLLPAAETFSYFASKFGFEYPKENFRNAWRNVLFNQFHDILPGSGIGEIYKDAEDVFAGAKESMEKNLNEALNTIALNINTIPKDMDFQIPVIVFNSLNWARNMPVEVEVEMPGSKLIVTDKTGKVFQTQVLETRKENNGLVKRILFIAEQIPPSGYKTFFVKRGKSRRYNNTLNIENDLIENMYFKVKIDPLKGTFTSFYDKRSFRELIPSGKEWNVIRLLEDKAPSMSAWVISLTGKEFSLKKDCDIKIIEKGKLRAKIRIKRYSQHSEFIQDITVLKNIPYLIIDNYIKWNEKNTMMRLSFPTDFQTDYSYYEIPFGWIERKNTGEEYPSQKWIDIGDEKSGLAVLNDSKYGFSVDSSNTMYITCLRSPVSPDPEADIGNHEFSIALYPHRETFRFSDVIKKGYEFNTVVPVRKSKIQLGSLPSNRSFFKVSNKNLIITAVKSSEDDKDMLIRFYETRGVLTETKIEFPNKFKTVFETDFIEWKNTELTEGESVIKFKMAPYSVKTLRVVF